MPPIASSRKLLAMPGAGSGAFVGNRETREPQMTSTTLRRVKQLSAALHREDGQAMVEYALLLSLIALVAFVAVQSFGLGVSSLFSSITAVVH
jgi:Flp pilus assembly pilin Flp